MLTIVLKINLNETNAKSTAKNMDFNKKTKLKIKNTLKDSLRNGTN